MGLRDAVNQASFRFHGERSMARDTAADWEKIGNTEPWYGVLSAPEFLTKNLTEEVKTTFYAQGVSEMVTITNILREKFAPFARK